MVNLTHVRVRLATMRAELATNKAAPEAEWNPTREVVLEAEIVRLESQEAALASAEGAEEVVRTGSGGSSRSRLSASAQISDVLNQVVHNRPVRGATAELQAECGVGSNVVPFEMFDGRPAAAASTVTSAGDRQVQEATEIQVFASPLSVAFGVDRSAIGVGVHAIPIVTAPTAGPTATVAIGTGVDDATLTIEGHTLTPSRLQVSASLGRDELASFDGLSSDVEMTLREAIMSGMDRQCLYAASSQGLLNFGTSPSAPSAVTTYAVMVADVLGAVDGRYAPMVDDLAALFGPASLAFAYALYRGTSDNESAAEKINRLTAALMTSAHVAVEDSSTHVQQAVVARGGRSHTGQVQRLWGGGVELIVDPFTKSADGQIRITAVLMMATAVIRPSMYKRVSFDLA